MQQRDRDATRTRADLAKGNVIGLAEQFQRRFDQQFCFRPGDQNSVRHLKLELEKFLPAGDVLQRFSLGSSLETLKKPPSFCRVNRILCVTKNEGTISLKNIREQRSGFASRFRHARLSQLVRALEYRLGY